MQVLTTLTEDLGGYDAERADAEAHGCAQTAQCGEAELIRIALDPDYTP